MPHGIAVCILVFTNRVLCNRKNEYIFDFRLFSYLDMPYYRGLRQAYRGLKQAYRGLRRAYRRLKEPYCGLSEAYRGLRAFTLLLCGAKS